jgi:hypothetical protein
MITTLIRSTLILGIALSFAGLAAAQNEQHPKSATTKAEKSRGTADAKDENIKQDRKANDPSSKLEAPPEKGGPKSRGSALCPAHIDNRTRWYIDVYTDGDYRGQVSPFGDLIGWVGCGYTKFYARATFDDGTVFTWGPTSYYVDGTFTWKLGY